MTAPDTTWSTRVDQLRREAVRSSTARGLAAAALASAGARAFGAEARVAGAAALGAGYLHRHGDRNRDAVIREARNGAKAGAFSILLPDTPLFFGDFALDADLAVVLARELQHKPEVVLEFGCGISTLVSAAMLKRSGRGRLYSIESDEGWAAITRSMLQSAGLEDVVEVVLAPLRDQEIGGVRTRWYDRAALAPLHDLAIDLMLVDGPPWFAPWARWPAVEVFHAQLNVGAVVLLDDGRRATERRAAYRWAADYSDLELYWIDTQKGAWRLLRTPQPRQAGRSEGLHRIARTLNPQPAGFGLMPVRRW